MRIVITGATSGLGREFALQYAQEGATHLALVGRREERLQEVAELCRGHGAQVLTWARDVTDADAMQELAKTFAAEAGGVDLVIANAGIGCPDRLASGDPRPLTRLMEVNVNGLLNTLLPFVPGMKEAGRGQLVAIASIAGFRAVPLHAGYAASKIAVRYLMDGFAYDLERWGITATTINPGFVVSEITDKNDFPMPFLLPVDVACRRMRKAIRKRKRVYSFPFPMRFGSWLGRFLPRFLIGRVRAH